MARKRKRADDKEQDPESESEDGKAEEKPKDYRQGGILPVEPVNVSVEGLSQIKATITASTLVQQPLIDGTFI